MFFSCKKFFTLNGWCWPCINGTRFFLRGRRVGFGSFVSCFLCKCEVGCCRYLMALFGFWLDAFAFGNCEQEEHFESFESNDSNLYLFKNNNGSKNHQKSPSRVRTLGELEVRWWLKESVFSKFGNSKKILETIGITNGTSWNPVKTITKSTCSEKLESTKSCKSWRINKKAMEKKTEFSGSVTGGVTLF